MSSLSRSKGELGEALVRGRLQALGLAMVRKVNTPWTVIRDRHGKIVDAYPVEKVEGDFRAIHPATGQSVLVEAKWREKKLQWSNLEKHQREHLITHDAAGGLSLLAWVCLPDTFILKWPVPGFGPGTSLNPKQAKALNLSRNDMS